MKRTAPVLAMAFLACATRVLAQDKAPAIPADLFPRPTGPYAVGTFDTLWVDSQRDEILTKSPNDKRHVPVRIWYPAQSTDAAPTKYVLRPEEFGDKSPFKPVLHVNTHALLHAPVAIGAERFPVLLYNHGGGWSRFTATYEIEQLASLGYIVVSVDHLGFDQSVLLSTGYRFAGDTLGFPKPTEKDLRADALASWDYLESVLFPMWVADAQFVLDRVRVLNRDSKSPLRSKFDLDRIGAFGWSFGGATAVDLLIRDGRIRAAVDQDGQLFGMGRTRGATRPVMLMHNTSDPAKGLPAEQLPILQELLNQVEGWDEHFRRASTSDVFDLKIARTEHGNFSDLTLFFPRDTSTLEPSRAHAIITAYTVAFFDQTLRGRKSALLETPSDAFPEVTFARKEGAPSSRQ